jgi:hypothetical protein
MNKRGQEEGGESLWDSPITIIILILIVAVVGYGIYLLLKRFGLV